MKEFKQILPTEIPSNVFELIGTDWMLVTASTNGKTNTMTASWGGLGIMWHKNVAFIVIRPQRYTKEFIDGSENLSLTFFDEEYKKVLSYLGSISGRNEDKIAKSELTLTTDLKIPYFSEGKLVLFCKKLYSQPFMEDGFMDKTIIEKWYPNNDLHTMYILEITKVLSKL